MKTQFKVLFPVSADFGTTYFEIIILSYFDFFSEIKIYFKFLIKKIYECFFFFKIEEKTRMYIGFTGYIHLFRSTIERTQFMYVICHCCEKKNIEIS